MGILSGGVPIVVPFLVMAVFVGGLLIWTWWARER
jgi:hypothetical protein